MKFHKWERVVVIQNCPQISPFHLIAAYVAATKTCVRPGGPLLFVNQVPLHPHFSRHSGITNKKFFGHVWHQPWNMGGPLYERRGGRTTEKMGPVG